ncbi:hypothetical protein EZV62_012089 [Acer yangbiense]|uniref:Uncharacterized protein n=1 Tax=Acer yangbiense TaxID=1000413 RepID=A0A5C7HWL8_9ROSI|nr:hypothetical protein EZV62_012089 [Acer yangbiense]
MKTRKQLVSIKRVVFAFAGFFFFICCKAASYSSPESTFTSKAADSYKQLGIKETHYNNGSGSKLMMKQNKESDHPNKKPTASRAYKKLQEAIHFGNVERAGNDHELISQLKKANKGVYGGGDLLHPRSKKGAASSLITSSSSFLSIAFRAVTIGLLVFVFF